MSVFLVGKARKHYFCAVNRPIVPLSFNDYIY